MRAPMTWVSITMIALLAGCGGSGDDGEKETGKDAPPSQSTAGTTPSPRPADSPPAPTPRPNPDPRPVPTPMGDPAPEPMPMPRPMPMPDPAPVPTAGESLDAQLAALVVPPAWLADVRTTYDTNIPWKDARQHIRKLFGENREPARREGIKLTWMYLQKDDIGNGHEYPLNLFLAGEELWAVRAFEEFLRKPHDNHPIFAEVALGSLYARYGEFEKGEAALKRALANLPAPPWRVMRQADIEDALGDLYATWGKTDDARDHYREAARLYPTAKPPYGRNLLGRRAAKVQSKLQLLATTALAEASLRDGTYRERALGYSGDVNLTVRIAGGRIADIDVGHSEKIDQGATTIIPQRIIDAQSLQVDGISGATVTRDAIVTGVHGALRKAGL